MRPDLGVTTFADLKGKAIATTTKTTAHIFLDRALRANGVDPKSVSLRDSSMSTAVASFTSGEVAAVALWVPFNIAVREKVPAAIKLVDASASANLHNNGHQHTVLEPPAVPVHFKQLDPSSRGRRP